MLHTDESAHAIAPADKPRKVTVGLGLYLLVNPNGSRWWRFRFRFNGRQNTLSCGIFPDVGVGEAIVRRDQYRALLADGLNPSDHNKVERADQYRHREEQRDAARFLVDSAGALSVRLSNRVVLLSPPETAELRVFLDATKTVACKVTPCL
ncbi:MAG: Arm DNA-binding domain-containing protein [Rhodanobacter sp.]